MKTNKEYIEDWLNSDLFDINAVGEDISAEEFIENEIYFETRV